MTAALIGAGRPRAAEDDPAAWRAEVMAAVQQAPAAPAALVARGEYYLWLGNASFAEADARTALQANWQNGPAWDLLSRAQEQKGLVADALAALEKAVQFAPGDSFQLIRLGTLRLLSGDVAAAEAAFAQSLGAEPDSSRLAAVAAGYARAGEVHATARSIERALSLQPSKADLKLLEAAAGQSQLADLAARCAALLTTEPASPAPNASAQPQADNPLERLTLAQQALAAGDLPVALSEAAAALQLAPELASAHDVRARAQAMLGEIAACIAEWRLALELDPSVARYLALTEALASSGDKKEADQTFREMMRAFPNHPQALQANADRLYLAGEFEAAAQEYERSARSSPRNPELLNMSANCRYKLGQFAEAIALYKRSLVLRFDPEVAANLARTRGRQEGAAAALAELGKFISEHPGEPGLLRARGDLRLTLSQYDDALRDFREALRLDPADPLSANGMGLCLLQLDRVEEALASFEAAANSGRKAEFWENAAHSAVLLERWSEVERLARAGLAMEPGNSALLSQLGDALVQLDRSAEALDVLIQAAAAGSDPALYLKAAQAAAAQEHPEAERRLWQEGLARFPADFSLQAAYAERLRLSKDEKGLLSLVNSARSQLGKDYPRLLDALASAWLAESEAARAEQFFEALIAAAPRDADAYAQLALVQAAQERFDTGLDTIKRGLNDAGSTYLGRYLECYLTAMTIGGDSALPLARELVKSPEAEPNGWLLLLRLLEEQGIYGEQVEQGHKALRAFPREGRILEYLARGLYFTGDSAAAVETLTGPGAESLDCPLRDQILGAAYLELGNWTRAASHLTTASNAAPLQAELRAQLGQAMLGLGHLQEALETLEAANELDPTLPSVHVWRGMLELERSNAEAAIDQFEIVKKSPLSGRDELAWATLGQARAAQLQGDSETARVRLSEAQAFGYNSDAFYSACDALEDALGS